MSLTRFIFLHQLGGTADAVDGGGHDAARVACTLAAGVQPGQGFADQRFLVAHQAHRAAGTGLQTRQHGIGRAEDNEKGDRKNGSEKLQQTIIPGKSPGY